MAGKNSGEDAAQVAHFHTEEARARVIEMYQTGHKLAEITRETGVPRATIYWILRREGISTNRVARTTDEALGMSEVLDALRRAEQEIGRLNGELARERAVTDWILSHVAIDRTAIIADLKHSTPAPARPRKR
jgi:uncharacterized protein YerC